MPHRHYRQLIHLYTCASWESRIQRPCHCPLWLSFTMGESENVNGQARAKWEFRTFTLTHKGTSYATSVPETVMHFCNMNLHQTVVHGHTRARTRLRAFTHPHTPFWWDLRLVPPLWDLAAFPSGGWGLKDLALVYIFQVA